MIQAIQSRRSVRTYEETPLNPALVTQLMNYAKQIDNPFHIPVEFKLMDAKRDGLSCPVVTGTNLYIGAKIKQLPNALIAFGYTFEQFVLYAQSLNIGTVWLGGTMNRSAFEQTMHLKDDEMMPCASPLGYPAKKMSLRETMMRKAVKADERLPFEELFYDSSFDCPLSLEKAGVYAKMLQMVRLAPSAVNKQPWRVLINKDGAHFYLKRSTGFSPHDQLDMQKIDLGIALCHFELAANELQFSFKFSQVHPNLDNSPDLEYIASYLNMKDE